DGSAIGRGKSGSSEATSAAGKARTAKSFMPFDGVSSRTKSMRLSDPEQSKPDATPTGTEVLAPNGANGRCHGFRNVRARAAPSPLGQIDRPEGIWLARDAGYSPLRAPETGAPAPAGAPNPASRHRSASNTRPDMRVCHWPGLSLMYLSTMATSWLGGRGVFAMHSSKLTSIFSLAVRFSAGTSERTAAPKSTRLSTTPVTYEERAATGRARHSLPVMAAAGAGPSEGGRKRRNQ